MYIVIIHHKLYQKFKTILKMFIEFLLLKSIKFLFSAEINNLNSITVIENAFDQFIIFRRFSQNLFLFAFKSLSKLFVLIHSWTSNLSKIHLISLDSIPTNSVLVKKFIVDKIMKLIN